MKNQNLKVFLKKSYICTQKLKDMFFYLYMIMKNLKNLKITFGTVDKR